MHQPFLSIIIPNRNDSATLGRCLRAACAHRDEGVEVIVVDDGSTDSSVDIAGQFPCTLLRLGRRAGAGAARNAGASAAKGDHLFFIDADCILLMDTLTAVRRAVKEHPDSVIGGTYTPDPADGDFFSVFQSVFIHYNETRLPEPDYIASHTLVIGADAFRASGGFPERFLPMIEDVEFSHRLRRAGHRLVMAQDILVQHIFNFTLRRSLANAYRKARYWTSYLLQSGGAFTDSGTASLGLKVNVAAFMAVTAILLAAALSGLPYVAVLAALPAAVAAAANRRLLRSFRQARGSVFALGAALYYLLLYPAPVAAGALTASLQHLAGRSLSWKERSLT